MNLPRSSGVLLHPTSLPSGRLGADARAFVDWLGAAGQTWWQVLPLGPPDEFDSPYKAESAFAGWPGLLEQPDAEVTTEELDAFVAAQAAWIDEWAAFAGEGAVADQVRFEREWRALRAYANERGVRLIGDLPIYVADGGADHLAHPELFVDDVVAGVPPDAFTDEGQRWGNPIYDWAAMRERGYRWWIERFRRTFSLVDLTRVDHFRGFVAYWAVPAEAETAKDGSWRPGPGRELFDAVAAELGGLPLIAEDLGVITEPVVRLRDELGLPGMHVLQFGFDDDPNNPHRPQAHRENGVVYTGTHDNDTARGWWDSLTDGQRARTGLDPADPAWSLLELAWSSRARLAIVPAQDLLGLGSEARMNVPGREAGNWRWRLEEGQLTDGLAARLRETTRAARR
ncbi:MAG: 4-alpha-glucanotransferase [Pseudomonadota bacterium]